MLLAIRSSQPYTQHVSDCLPERIPLIQRAKYTIWVHAVFSHQVSHTIFRRTWMPHKFTATLKSLSKIHNGCHCVHNVLFFFFSSFILSPQQANRRVLCENMSQQTGNCWATKTIYWQNPSISLLANTSNLTMVNITDQKQTKENVECLSAKR